MNTQTKRPLALLAAILAAALFHGAPAFAGDGASRVDQALAAFKRGDAPMGIQTLNDAIPMLEKEIAASPGDASLHAKLGEAYFHVQEGELALVSLERALELDPDHALALYYKSALLCQSGDLQTGERGLRRAAELNPAHAPTWTLLASIEASRGDLDAAEELLHKAANIDPTDAQPLALLGSIAYERGDLPGTIALWDRALELDPRDKDLLGNMGQLLQSQGDLAGAKSKFDAIVELDPADWRSIAKLVQLCEALGLKDERDRRRAALYELYALVDARHAMFYQDGARRYYCRDQFEASGRHVMAFEYFDYAVKPDPTNASWDLGVRYSFDVMKPDGEIAYRITLGSYEEKNEEAKAAGEIAPDGRLFHLDGYFKNSVSEFARYSTEPTYDVVKAKVIEAIANPSATQLRASTLPGAEPAASTSK